MRFSHSKFVRLASGEISETSVLMRSSHSKLTACSSPVRSAIPRPAAQSSVKWRIASAVIAAPAGSPRVSRITAANSASGIETSACTGGAVNCAKTVNTKISVKTVNFFIWISPFECGRIRTSTLIRISMSGEGQVFPPPYAKNVAWNVARGPSHATRACERVPPASCRPPSFVKKTALISRFPLNYTTLIFFVK